jgi:hypothetical protein
MSRASFIAWHRDLDQRASYLLDAEWSALQKEYGDQMTQRASAPANRIAVPVSGCSNTGSETSCACDACLRTRNAKQLAEWEARNRRQRLSPDKIERFADAAQIADEERRNNIW